MLCCVIAACFIARYLIKWDAIAKYFGFTPKDDGDRYGYREYCELDAFDD